MPASGTKVLVRCDQWTAVHNAPLDTLLASSQWLVVKQTTFPYYTEAICTESVVGDISCKVPA